MYLFFICMSFLEKCLFPCPVHSLNPIGVLFCLFFCFVLFLLLSCMNSLYILDINAFQIFELQIFAIAKEPLDESERGE